MLEEQFLKSFEEYNNALRAEGAAKARVEGRKEAHALAVRNMLAADVPRSRIAAYLGLSAEEVDRLAEAPAEEDPIR